MCLALDTQQLFRKSLSLIHTRASHGDKLPFKNTRGLGKFIAEHEKLFAIMKLIFEFVKDTSRAMT